MGGQGQETRKDSGLRLWKKGRCPGSCRQEGSESQSCGQGPLVSRGWRLAYYLCLKDSTRLSAAPEGQLLGLSGEKILQHSRGIYTGVAALAGSIHVGGIRVAGMGKEEHGRGHMFFFFLIYLFIYLFVNFVIHWNETDMGLHLFPILIPPPTSLSTRSP